MKTFVSYVNIYQKTSTAEEAQRLVDISTSLSLTQTGMMGAYMKYHGNKYRGYYESNTVDSYYALPTTYALNVQYVSNRDQY